MEACQEPSDNIATLYARRLMDGDRVSEDEMRVIVAGLMLSVDRLARGLSSFEKILWSEDKLRALVGEEIEKHCAAKALAKDFSCPGVSAPVPAPAPVPYGGSAPWVGRMVRAVLGFR